MGKPLVRVATRNDLESILGLVVELAVYEKEPDAVTATMEDYQRAFDEELISAFVAAEDGVVIGMALYYMTFSTWKGHMMHLEDFYVKKEYRSSGIGQDLFDKFIAASKERKCTMVRWQVLDWNTNATKFYERNGATVEKNWWNCKIIFDQ